MGTHEPIAGEPMLESCPGADVFSSTEHGGGR
jgi:hypothetical protein